MADIDQVRIDYCGQDMDEYLLSRSRGNLTDPSVRWYGSIEAGNETFSYAEDSLT